MQLDSGQLLMLLQWMDSAFPTGAFAHSGALETYTQAGIIRTADDLARLIRVRLNSAARTDLILIHESMNAAAVGDWDRIMQLDELCGAAKTTRETREASEKIGRRMLASILNLKRDPALEHYRDAIAAGRCVGHHPIVHGLGCAALNVEPRAALLAFAYGLAVNQTAASLKLMPIGQTQTQAVLGALGLAMADAVETALNRTLDDFGSFTPGLDIRAAQHEHLFRRLFIS
ncbi:MAG: urease accessory protein UreF [Anaerolineae bacterium]|nr:urease accessory protein UreF [Anaerolineae bacterium]